LYCTIKYVILSSEIYFIEGWKLMELDAAIADYVEQVTGERPEITPISPADLARLPVYLSHIWHLKKMLLLGHEVVLALPAEGSRTGLSRVIKDCAVLVSRLEIEVIPVLPDIKSYERRQLVQKRIPFVAPGKQLFLPMFLADFRETFSVSIQPPREAMSWISQIIVLRRLLGDRIEERSLAEIAEMVGYTAMAVTHGVRELMSLGLCVKVARGRARTIRFDLHPQALWERALVHMRSPVVRRYPVVEVGGRITEALEAGLSALSEKTTLAYNGPRILAMPNREVNRLFSDGILEQRLYEDDADLVLEGWSYRPQLLANGPVVDEFSLHLSLKDDPDERVQRAITDMMAQRAW